MKVRKGVIPAAGLGTRMLPATKTVPKEMLPMVDKPVIQYIIEEAVASGIEDILIVTNRAKSAMDDYFDYHPELEERLLRDNKRKKPMSSACPRTWRISSTSGRRKRRAWATPSGGPALCGREPFAVLLGDVS
jgi:UTP--glucose-1-phosphate uridylyltransferase